MLTGGAGANTLTGSSAGSDIFRDTAANLNGDTIVNLLASDVIDITDLAPATTMISKVTVSGASTVVTLLSGTTNSKVTLSGVVPGQFARCGRQHRGRRDRSDVRADCTTARPSPCRQRR